MDEFDYSQYYAQIAQAQREADAWSAAEAEKARSWQKEMSDTAHQREVADLKAAGLNPVLSAGGSGATTGSAVVAQRDSKNVDALISLASQAFKAQIEQAEAMKTTAQTVAGTGGSASPISLSEGPEGSSAYELARDVFADWLKRKLGISQDKTKEIVDRTVGKLYGQRFRDSLGDLDTKEVLAAMKEDEISPIEALWLSAFDHTEMTPDRIHATEEILRSVGFKDSRAIVDWELYFWNEHPDLFQGYKDARDFGRHATAQYIMDHPSTKRKRKASGKGF